MTGPQLPSTGCAILLYGSRARGDHDDASDVDVLVLSPRPADLTMQRCVQAAMAVEFEVPEEQVSISSYSFPEMARMAKAGTLFARHVASEARLISSDEVGAATLAQVLASVPSGPFEISTEDLRIYRTALSDVVNALNTATVDHVFELVQLRTLLRHLSVLASAAEGAPVFGRVAAFKAMVRNYALPALWADDFATLFSMSAVDRRTVEMWLDRVSRCLIAVEQHVSGVAA